MWSKGANRKEGSPMLRHRLTDQQWKTINGFFSAPKRTGRPPRDRRTIVDGILWILRTGSPWRDLPNEFGPWGTVWDLFDTWNNDGTLDKILNGLRSDAFKDGGIDDELWLVDGSSIRAAKCAAGGGKKGIRRNRQITRSAVHAVV